MRVSNRRSAAFCPRGLDALHGLGIAHLGATFAIQEREAVLAARRLGREADPQLPEAAHDAALAFGGADEAGQVGDNHACTISRRPPGVRRSGQSNVSLWPRSSPLPRAGAPLDSPHGSG